MTRLFVIAAALACIVTPAPAQEYLLGKPEVMHKIILGQFEPDDCPMVIRVIVRQTGTTVICSSGQVFGVLWLPQVGDFAMRLSRDARRWAAEQEKSRWEASDEYKARRAAWEERCKPRVVKGAKPYEPDRWVYAAPDCASGL